MNHQLHLPFFNTIGLSPVVLGKETARAVRQEWRVWDILNTAGTHLTPYEVHKIYEKRFCKCSKVSIGRALTRGTKAGIFKKVSVMKKGDWHLPNNQWLALPVENRENIKFKS